MLMRGRSGRRTATDQSRTVQACRHYASERMSVIRTTGNGKNTPGKVSTVKFPGVFSYRYRSRRDTVDIDGCMVTDLLDDWSKSINHALYSMTGPNLRCIPELWRHSWIATSWKSSHPPLWTNTLANPREWFARCSTMPVIISLASFLWMRSTLLVSS